MRLLHILGQDILLRLFELPLEIFYGMTGYTIDEDSHIKLLIIRAMEFGFNEDDHEAEPYFTVIRCNLHKIFAHFIEKKNSDNNSDYRSEIVEALMHLDQNKVPPSEKHAIYRTLLHFSEAIKDADYYGHHKAEEFALTKSCKEYDFLKELLQDEKVM